MAKDWAFAKLVKDAAIGGGPDIWKKNIWYDGFKNGVKQGISYCRKKELIPAMIASSTLTATVIKVVDFFTEKKNKEDVLNSQDPFDKEIKNDNDLSDENWVDTIIGKFIIEQDKETA